MGRVEREGRREGGERRSWGGGGEGGKGEGKRELVPVAIGVVNGADAARVVRGREVLPAEVVDGEGRRHHRRNGGLGGE